MVTKLLLSFLFGAQVMAAEVIVKPFDIPVTTPTNLMNESTLKLESESSIQEVAPRSDLGFSMLGGTMRVQRVALDNHGRIVRYDFTKKDALPFLSAQVSYFPVMQRWGKLGLQGSLGYTYGEYYQTTVTSLHIIPIELAAVYKLDLKNTQFLIPYIAYGRQSVAFIQRGIEQFNTSENFDSWVGTAGFSLNLSRLRLFSSRNDLELVFQYKRAFANPTSRADINGQSYQIGGAFSL